MRGTEKGGNRGSAGIAGEIDGGLRTRHKYLLCSQDDVELCLLVVGVNAASAREEASRK